MSPVNELLTGGHPHLLQYLSMCDSFCSLDLSRDVLTTHYNGRQTSPPWMTDCSWDDRATHLNRQGQGNYIPPPNEQLT